jgi:hypothetical protein
MSTGRIIKVKIGSTYVSAFWYHNEASKERAIQKALLLVMEKFMGRDVSPWPYIYDADKLVFQEGTNVTRTE